MSRQVSEISIDDDEFEDIEVNADDRKEHKREGAIEFSTYKNFFKAVHSNIYVITVFALFGVSQAIWSGADYFLTVWYVCCHNINSSFRVLS